MIGELFLTTEGRPGVGAEDLWRAAGSCVLMWCGVQSSSAICSGAQSTMVDSS